MESCTSWASVLFNVNLRISLPERVTILTVTGSVALSIFTLNKSFVGLGSKVIFNSVPILFSIRKFTVAAMSLLILIKLPVRLED
ncbi:hypothetical protein D3C85_1689610 [compost metagenome]